MGTMMQAFYWDCPKDMQGEWWNFIRSKIGELAALGVDRIWLPPAQKSFGWISMGYDPFDYYDLGEFDQRGRKETWFGTKNELVDLIKTAKHAGIGSLADLVLNHNSGGYREENQYLETEELIREYGIDKKEKATWTKFNPASGKFHRNLEHFYPNDYGTKDEGRFGRMPDLCHFHPYVYSEILEYARWLNEEIGFEGFRYDMVKGFGDWITLAIQKYRKCFSVGEYWDSKENIENWLYDVNYTCSVFDFPLRETLKKICYAENLLPMLTMEAVTDNHPFKSVTFVENHDTDKDHPIVPNKMWAYSYILTHEGYPCIFWKDFYNYGLARFGTARGIAKLMEIHEKHASGETRILYLPWNRESNYYVMERVPKGNRTKGLLYCLNTSAEWEQVEVRTSLPNTHYVPEAWDGVVEKPLDQYSDGEGNLNVWIPPKGYCVYIPH